MLKVENVEYRYGMLQALDDVSLQVGEGEIVSLLGMNGAGKTTLLGVVSGLLRPRRGQISFRGRPITRLSPSKIVRSGVVQVPEGRQVFGPLSVRENLELGAYLRIKARDRSGVEQDMKRVLSMFPVLAERLAQPAATLSGGEQQMLAIARGLMARPRLMLLDEPSLGLAPMVAAEIFETIRRLPESGCSVLLVEQNAIGALGLSDRGYIITSGRIRFEGTPDDILQDKMLREAFLGPERAHGEGLAEEET
jgi:branched-chain amino acid transport system ATP-binding protein